MSQQSEKKAINDVRLLFGKSTSETKEFFESIGIGAVFSFLKDETITIPYIGELKISYEGDESTSNGRVAKLNCDFTPSDFLVRNIGQIEDDTTPDAEVLLRNRLKSIFRTKLEQQ